jgi:hypothetical protein
MADPPRLPGGWLPPQPPGDRPPPRQPAPVPASGDRGTNGLAIAAVACAIGSLGLLVLSLGLSFAVSLPLALIAWACAVRARRDLQPGHGKAGLVLAIVAVALSVVAAVVWVALMASGVSVEDLQEDLERELERRRQSAS